MPKKKKSNGKRKNIHPELARLFKMSAGQIASVKRSGGGVHKSGPKYKTRAEQERRAIDDQL